MGPRLGLGIKDVDRLNAPAPEEVKLAVKFRKAVFMAAMRTAVAAMCFLTLRFSLHQPSSG